MKVTPIVPPVHASIELIRAIQGTPPAPHGVFPRLDSFACDGKSRETTHPRLRSRVMAARYDGKEDVEPVTCGSCLRQIRSVTEPVRWDALCERGLVSLT